MFRINDFQKVHTPRQLDENGMPVNRVPIDQWNSQEHNVGRNGLPASDITLLMRAQNEKEYMIILSRLKEVRVVENNKDKSDKQLIEDMMPSWVQTPAEIDKFMNWYNETHKSTFAEDVKKGKPSEAKPIKFSEENEPSQPAADTAAS